MLDSLPGDTIARAIYLTLIASAAIIFVLRRIGPNVVRLLQNVTAWAVIFGIVVAAGALWEDIRDHPPIQSYSSSSQQITVPRSRDGHYYLTLEINQVPIRFVVDTGATDMVLTQEAAKAAGIPLDNLPYMGRAMTANGEVRTANVVLKSVSLEGITDRNIRASVNGGDLHESLLGMRYLQRFEKLEISGGQLVLTR